MAMIHPIMAFRRETMLHIKPGTKFKHYAAVCIDNWQEDKVKIV